ncbi:MAG: hypothetical protein IT458_17630 [Planctomycetes bacterium]|nr:hypothetical protein [Planctomycetota bacterium]
MSTAPSRCVPHCFGLLACAALAAQQPEAVTPEAALGWLRQGNLRHAAHARQTPPPGPGTLRTLAAAERPLAVVITTTDPRLHPESVFDRPLGDLHVLRTPGNVCDPDSLAAVEHAVGALGTPLVVVLAMAGDPVVAEAVDGVELSPSLLRVQERIAPALRRARAEALSGQALRSRCEEENAYQTASDLHARSPLLRAAVRDRRLAIVAARHRLDTGMVEWLPVRPPEAAESPAPPRAKPRNGIPPQIALELLRAGHARFASGQGGRSALDPERRAALGEGRAPYAVVVACSDARVAPEIVFDAEPGDLAVVRGPGPVLSDESLAGLERAAQDGAALVLVLVHAGCDVVQRAVAPRPEAGMSPAGAQLLDKLAPALERARATGSEGAALAERTAAFHAQRFVTEARRRSRLLAGLEHRGRLVLQAARYHPDSGDLEWLPVPAPALPRPDGPLPEDRPAAPPGPELAPAREPHVAAAAGPRTEQPPPAVVELAPGAAPTAAPSRNGGQAAHDAAEGAGPAETPHAAAPDGAEERSSPAPHPRQPLAPATPWLQLLIALSVLSSLALVVLLLRRGRRAEDPAPPADGAG